MWTFALVALLLAGCVAIGPQVIVLKNPRTDQVEKCQGNAMRDWRPSRVAEACAQDLERDGWVRLTPKE